MAFTTLKSQNAPWPQTGGLEEQLMVLGRDPLAVSFSQPTKCGGLRQVKATSVAAAVITFKM